MILMFLFTPILRKPVLYHMQRTEAQVLVCRIHHISLRPLYGTKANGIAPDVTPQNAASYLGIFCLLTKISSKNEMKMKYYS